MKKECREKKYISTFMDGELSSKDKKRVETHLETCPECQKEIATLQSLNSLFREMKEIEPSHNFARGFWKKMEDERAGKIRWDIINPFTWGWPPSVVATTAMILLVGGIVFLQKTPHSLFNPISDSALDKSSNTSVMLIAEDLDFYQDMELISQLDLLENWDVINRIEEI